MTLIDRLPKRVRIGPHDFSIEPWTAERQALVSARLGRLRTGEFSSWELRISLAVAERPLSDVVDTLFHEMHHAIMWVYGQESADSEERLCGVLGTAWAQIVRDNAYLMEWLAEAGETMADPLTDYGRKDYRAPRPALP